MTKTNPPVAEGLAEPDNLVPRFKRWMMNTGYDGGGPSTPPKRLLAAYIEAQAHLAEVRRVLEALQPFMPITTNYTADYAELYFGEHQTQAMTMAPDDWERLNAAYDAARSLLSQGEEG